MLPNFRHLIGSKEDTSGQNALEFFTTGWGIFLQDYRLNQGNSPTQWEKLGAKSQMASLFFTPLWHSNFWNFSLIQEGISFQHKTSFATTRKTGIYKCFRWVRVCNHVLIFIVFTWKSTLKIFWSIKYFGRHLAGVESVH